MAKVAKTGAELQEDFHEALELLEINSKIFDCISFSAAKQISNSLHQLVDDRGQNKSHMNKMGLLDTLKIWKSPTKLEPGSDFSNVLVGVIFGITTDNFGLDMPAAFNLPAHLHEGHMKLAAVGTTVENWLDEPVIRLGSGEEFNRRSIIRAVRDQDAGAHSDQFLDSLYADFKKSHAINPKSKITIEGKSVEVGPLLRNPALATLRQIAHEFLSSVYSNHELRPIRNPHCLIYEYGSSGELEHIRRPKGYHDLPIQMPSDLLVEH